MDRITCTGLEIVMSNTQSELEQILRNYKKSCTSWEARATNDLPPNNQKGRIIQEIDAEAIAAIGKLMLRERLDEIVNVVQGTHKVSYEDYLLKRIAELQKQLDK